MDESCSHCGNRISFEAPADDGMSIAASEVELGFGDDDLAALPPSGRVALPESDPELTALPFGLSLLPHVFTKVVEAALVPLREADIHVLNYLDNWLILAQSRAMLCEHRDTVLSHHSRLGLQVNWEKSKLSPAQRISFLGMELDSVNLTARLSLECAQSMLICLESFQRKRVVPLKHFQWLLGHMASAAAVTLLGLLHMRPLQRWLHDRVPRWA